MTSDQILALIPDQKSDQLARRLTKAKQWKQMATNTRLLWGQCRSKGTRYFHTMVDLLRPHYYCNCSSRKRPCSHVLALYFMFSESGDSIKVDSEVPDWALELRPKMIAHGALIPDETPEERQARREARLAKRAKRIMEMKAGLLALEDWLVDVLRQGIAKLSEIPPSFWEDQASRLTDAKLGSLARRVRKLARIVETPNWPEKLLEELGQIYLLIRGFERLDKLPDPMAYELMSQAGLALRKDEIFEEPGIPGKWLIAGKVSGYEEDLQFRRLWVYELETARFGLILDFVWGDQKYDRLWEVGRTYIGNAHFYPAAYPQRMILDDTDSKIADWPDWQAFESWSALYAHTSQVLGQHPWLARIPVVVRAIPVFIEEDQWMLVDQNKKQIRLEGHSDSLWSLMALSTGNPILLLVEWDGEVMQLVSVLHDERIVEA